MAPSIGVEPTTLLHATVFKTASHRWGTRHMMWLLALDFFDKGGTSGSQKPPLTHCSTATLSNSGLKMVRLRACGVLAANHFLYNYVIETNS